MPVLGVDGWRGAWVGALLDGRTATLLALQNVRGFSRRLTTVIVPLAQAAANVAVHLQEPQSNDSFAYWGFFNAIFEQKEYGEGYVIGQSLGNSNGGVPHTSNDTFLINNNFAIGGPASSFDCFTNS